MLSSDVYSDTLNVTIYTGKKGGKYYKIDGDITRYDINFPIKCAISSQNYDIKSQISPPNCLNCQRFGSYNGIQLTLCAICCQLKEYRKLRCNCNIKYLQNHIDYQLDHFKTMPEYMILECDHENCIFNTLYEYKELIKTHF